MQYDDEYAIGRVRNKVTFFGFQNYTVGYGVFQKLLYIVDIYIRGDSKRYSSL